MEAETNFNPLLQITSLPIFSAVRPEHIKPAVDTAIANCRNIIIKTIEKHRDNPTWDNVIAPIEEADDRFSKIWSVVSHLNGVNNTPELREAYESCLPELSQYSTWVGQYRPLFDVMEKIALSDSFQMLTRAQRKSIKNSIRDFKLSGIDLPEQQKKRYGEISEQLSLLQSKFANNVLDATHAFTRHVTDRAQLKGLPAGVIKLAAAEASRRQLEGWVFTLDAPSYIPLLTYADDRELRREMYEAYNTRASELGPNAGQFDNAPVIEQILALRHEEAGLLGYKTYAHLSLATKMAGDPDEVLGFLHDLARKSHAQGEREVQELREFAASCGLDVLEPWDVSYYAEKLRQERYAYNAEELRPYFPVDKVIQGMFECAHRVFDISFRSRLGVDVWNENVCCYDVFDSFGSKIGTFYTDLYAREGKRGGAWMDECMSRRYRADGMLQLPVAYLVCNFGVPVNGQPSLLTHSEVVTLFHEFGHTLNQLLTRIDIADVSGINGVPWDAVELPSQFNECFAWEEEVLNFLSSHQSTRQPLPREKLEALIKARNFESAMAMLRQLEFAIFDFRVHLEYHPGMTYSEVNQLLDQVRDEVMVVPRCTFSRFANNFTHIFAGGYAAGYYSYKWAEVLAADAFGRFKEEGICNPEVGADFRDYIMARGGSVDPMRSFIDFRGRRPQVDALLEQSGITAETQAD